MNKRRPKCTKCNQPAVMVDYVIDRVDCTINLDRNSTTYSPWDSTDSRYRHTTQCLFPKPEYFCFLHWGMYWPFEDNYPWYETVTTWQKNKRPRITGYRSPAQLKEMYGDYTQTPMPIMPAY